MSGDPYMPRRKSRKHLARRKADDSLASRVMGRATVTFPRQFGANITHSPGKAADFSGPAKPSQSRARIIDSTFDAASGMLVPGPKIAATPASLSIAWS